VYVFLPDGKIFSNGIDVVKLVQSHTTRKRPLAAMRSQDRAVCLQLDGARRNSPADQFGPILALRLAKHAREQLLDAPRR
jgi:hypothetical protein